MKFLFILLISFNLFAHDEGHGPKLSDQPKQGGVVSSVVLAEEANKGAKAGLVYKAELVRSAGIVSVFVYDTQMKPLPLDGFKDAATGELITRKKGKVSVQKFELKRHGDHFMAQMPKPLKKPYNIDVKLSEGARVLLVAFDNLD